MEAEKRAVRGGGGGEGGVSGKSTTRVSVCGRNGPIESKGGNLNVLGRSVSKTEFERNTARCQSLVKRGRG